MKKLGKLGTLMLAAGILASGNARAEEKFSVAKNFVPALAILDARDDSETGLGQELYFTREFKLPGATERIVPNTIGIMNRFDTTNPATVVTYNNTAYKAPEGARLTAKTIERVTPTTLQTNVTTDGNVAFLPYFNTAVEVNKVLNRIVPKNVRMAFPTNGNSVIARPEFKTGINAAKDANFGERAITALIPDYVRLHANVKGKPDLVSIEVAFPTEHLIAQSKNPAKNALLRTIPPRFGFDCSKNGKKLAVSAFYYLK